MKKKKIDGHLVKMKSIGDLRDFGRPLGGSAGDSLSFFIKHSGELMETSASPNTSFSCFTKRVLDCGQEFLVIDHPNVITKREYDMSKALYDDVKEVPHSNKGVY